MLQVTRTTQPAPDPDSPVSSPSRGAIHWVELGPPEAETPSSTRSAHPCLVVTTGVVNQRRRSVVVIPLSTASPPRFPLYVPLPSLLPGAQAVVDQIFAVDKDRILDLVAIATEAEMQQVAQAMKLLFELDA